MDVSIIIVNYNTEKYIKDCLASIYKQVVDIDFEIIIVDNNSAENSLDEIKEMYPAVRFVMLDRNLGFGTANNRGTEVATGRNLFLLNPDTILLNNAVKILSDVIDNDATIGVCGGNLFNEDLTPAHSYLKIFPGIFSEINLILLNGIVILRWGNNRHFNRTNKAISVARVSGADMMIKKSLYNSIAGFDENFFMYNEETELMYRIKRLGYQNLSIPNSKIIHLEGKSFTHKELACRFGMISRKKFISKRYKSKSLMLICNFLHVIACINFMIVSLILGRKEFYQSWKYELMNINKINEHTPYLVNYKNNDE